MATYRYLLGDLLTNTINLELSLFGVTYGRRLNKAGNATFSITLGNKGTAGTPGDVGYSNSDILNATQPGRSVLWIERDGALVWGGIVWSRTYDSQASVLTYTAQSFESYLYFQILEIKKSYVGQDQRAILVDLINYMQTKPYANIGIITPTTYGPSAAIVRTVDFFSYIGWTVGRAIEYLTQYNLGFDYTIDVAYDNAGVPQKYLNVDNKLGASQIITSLAFDYPGNVKAYFYPESASNAATSMLGFGGGTGASMTRTKYIIQSLLDAGYPDLQQSYDNTNVFSLATLVNQTKAAGDLAAVPVIVPTIEIFPDQNPAFGSYGLGDYFRMHVEDLRFPGGQDVLARIIGWDVTPPNSTTLETVKLVLEGAGN